MRRHTSKTRTRQPYRGSRAFVRSCRNHGQCQYCAEGRRHKTRRRCPSILYEIAADVVPSTEGAGFREAEALLSEQPGAEAGVCTVRDPGISITLCGRPRPCPRHDPIPMGERHRGER